MSTGGCIQQVSKGEDCWWPAQAARMQTATKMQKDRQPMSWHPHSPAAFTATSSASAVLEHCRADTYPAAVSRELLQVSGEQGSTLAFMRSTHLQSKRLKERSQDTCTSCKLLRTNKADPGVKDTAT